MSPWPGRWRRRSREADLDTELRFHMRRQLDDYLAAGLSPEDARRRLGLEFGTLERAKEACRDVRPLQALDTIARDVRLGFRTLARERLFAFSVTAILAAGIGLTVAMFSVLNGIVLRPLPYARPNELAILSTHALLQNQFEGTSRANFIDWRRQSAAFAGMTLYRRSSASQVVYAGADAPQRAQEGLVGQEFFELIGVQPLIGRSFTREEFDRGERVVVLSEGLWQSEFARSNDVLGRRLSIAGQDHVVIGIMPRSFQLPTGDTRFWRPLSVLGQWWVATQHVRDGDSFEVIGRLAPGVQLDDARSEMAVVAARLREAHPENTHLDIRVDPLVDRVVDSRTRRGLWLGFGAAMALLAIACANAGGLMAARAAERRRELAVRAALGAGRSRLVRQLLAETVSLWAVASSLGLLLASGLVRLIVAYAPAGVPRMDEVGLELTSVVVAFLVGLIVVAFCGTLPALVGSNVDATAAFRSREPSGPSGHRLQSLFVTMQIGGAMTLLVGALLLAQSFLRVQAEEPGYPSESLLIVRIERATSPRFFLDARERLGRLPGVMAVGGITDFFIRRAGDQQVTIEGRSFADADGHRPRLVLDSVTPGYFRAMGIDMLEGRDFDDRDLEPGAPAVAIVNHAIARRFWPNESAIGKRLVGGGSPPKDDRWATVVGVARDMRREGLEVPPVLSVFIPAMLRRMDLTVRATGSMETLIPAIRQEIRAIDAALPVPSIVTAGARLDERLGARRFETQALTIFAIVALLLAAGGLYASVAYQVTLRRREIGIRAALGARDGAIVGMFVARGVRLALLGITLGAIGSLSLTRLLQGLLYQTPAVNPVSYLGAAAVVLSVAVFAAWQPARRTACVSTMTILRDE
jgi:putative ABC transport system permease protein